MAGGVVVGVVGAKKLRKELRKAEFDMRQLKEPHQAAARVVAYAAKPRTPKRSGRLARSVRSTGTTTMGTVRAGNSGKVPYANPIHWGWPERNIAPQPWVSEAAQRTEPTWVQIFLDYMNDLLARVNGAGGA